MPIPRVLNIHVLRSVVALELDVAGNSDVVPLGHVERRLLKALRHLTRVLRINEFPLAVQGPQIPALTFFRFPS